MTSGLSLLAFLLVATVVATSMLLFAAILRVKAKTSSKLKPQTYECGEAPSGMAWVRFHARYYVVALFFVLFDIEAAFLFPWAIRVRELGEVGFIAIVSFVVVLMLGWAWAQRKGALEWQ
jgi:NADH-quinone oxidoreductase subunit A